MSRILIEFYSRRAPENLIALLKDRFDGISFLYFQDQKYPSKEIQSQLNRVVRDLFGFDATFISVPNKSIQSVLDTLRAITNEEDQYVMDITGGCELFLAAAGIFSEQKNRKSVLCHYDVKSGRKTDEFPRKEKEADVFPKHLKAHHLLALNGTPPLSAPEYIFSYGALREEILRLWKAILSHSKEWNRFCSLSVEEPLKVNPFHKIYFVEEKERRSFDTIADSLEKAGILINKKTEKCKDNFKISFDLAVEKEALFLYKKAGNLLEMYTALAAFDAGIFSDIRVGVTVDWNGIPSKASAPDPRNEIDLILVKENLPILASCKNTFPKNDFLYEISTMASHYGGYYATPMLLSTYRATSSVRARAKEMGLILIDDIRKIPYEKLVSLFQKSFRK